MNESFWDWLWGIIKGTRRLKNACVSCGECCKSFGWHLNASKTDLDRWRREGREDLLSSVNRLGWIWMDPQTGEPLETCPFLVRDETKGLCSIHETKPAMCRDYPTLAHGHRCLRGF